MGRRSDCDIILNVIMDAAIRVEGLVKRFGAITAVDQVSFSVKPGEVFGILGPNGAGKTTTLEIIEGLQKPTEGSVSVLGMDVQRQPSRIKARIGVQLQSSAYFDYLTLREILALLGSFYPKRLSPDTLLEQVGLADQASRRVRQLSGGQQQRFTVAASLVNDPEMVILDEPTTGLDPQSRRNLWGLIREINQRGVTVVLTTHYMEEAETLCDRLAIMDMGKLLSADTPQNLINQLQSTYTVNLVPSEPLSEWQVAALNEACVYVQAPGDNTGSRIGNGSGSSSGNGHGPHEDVFPGNAYILRLADEPRALDTVLEQIVGQGIKLERMEVSPVTLEDVFLTLTGNELRD